MPADKLQVAMVTSKTIREKVPLGLVTPYVNDFDMSDTYHV